MLKILYRTDPRAVLRSIHDQKVVRSSLLRIKPSQMSKRFFPFQLWRVWISPDQQEARLARKQHQKRNHCGVLNMVSRYIFLSVDDDSNPGPQDGRCIRIHWAVAATRWVHFHRWSFKEGDKSLHRPNASPLPIVFSFRKCNSLPLWVNMST